MKIAIDISADQFILFLKTMPENFKVHIGLEDIELFKHSMRLATPKMNWNVTRDQIQSISALYGVEVNVVDSIFDDDFWVDACKQIFAGVDVEFQCYHKTLADDKKSTVRFIPHLPCANIHHFIEYKVIRNGEDETYEELRTSGGQWLEPDSAVDDDICWWTYWNGVPRIERSFIITAIRKIMSDPNVSGFVSVYWDTEKKVCSCKDLI